jgi:hypothetical protein
MKSVKRHEGEVMRITGRGMSGDARCIATPPAILVTGSASKTGRRTVNL